MAQGQMPSTVLLFLLITISPVGAAADRLNLTSGLQTAQRAEYCIIAADEGKFERFIINFEDRLGSGLVKLDGEVLTRFTDTSQHWLDSSQMQSPPILTRGLHRITIELVTAAKYKDVQFGAETGLREVSCAQSSSGPVNSVGQTGLDVSGEQRLRAVEERVANLENRLGGIEAKLGIRAQAPGVQGRSLEERMERTEKTVLAILDAIQKVKEKVDAIKSPPSK